MRISEVKLTIQGEGLHLGMPCILIRLSGCNLTCSFCDTKWALTGGKNTTPQELAIHIYNNYILKYNYTPLILITGGEPLLYFDEINEFIQHLYNLTTNITINIETNGTKLVSKEICQNIAYLSKHYAKLIITISPKLNKKFYPDNDIDLLDLFNNINDILILSKSISNFNCVYKFIYTINDAEMILKMREILSKDKTNIFYCMGFTPPIIENYEDKFHKNCLDTVDFCIRNNFLYSPRIHLNLFGSNNIEWEELNATSTDRSNKSTYLRSIKDDKN